VSFERPLADVPAGPSPRLAIPVAGVLATDLEDNFGAPRTPTRNHLGLDIRAPLGTPVVAAAAGTIVRLDESGSGGITIHQRALDGRTILYYAHLRRRAARLSVGDLVAQGDTIAYVGDSGNAEGIPHLHFAVYAVQDPNEISDGRHFDPYPLLVEAAPKPDDAP
jgi:murein DD-endopeptidase MepM/ murein hydrolase activator NlpD